MLVNSRNFQHFFYFSIYKNLIKFKIKGDFHSIFFFFRVKYFFVRKFLIQKRRLWTKFKKRKGLYFIGYPKTFLKFKGFFSKILKFSIGYRNTLTRKSILTRRRYRRRRTLKFITPFKETKVFFNHRKQFFKKKKDNCTAQLVRTGGHQEFIKNLSFVELNKNKVWGGKIGLVALRKESHHITPHYRYFLKYISFFFKRDDSKFFFKREYNWNPNPLDKKKKRRDSGPRRVFFKHAFFKVVKEARANFIQYFDLGFRYQHRLTRYLFKFKKVSAVAAIRFFFYSIENLLKKSNLVVFPKHFSFFYEKSYIFLNGLIVKNKKEQLFRGDTLSLFISWNIYIYLKLLFLKLKNYKFKLNHLFFTYIRQQRRPKTFNYWFSKFKNIIRDVPACLEVDFLTLSFLVIYEPPTALIVKEDPLSTFFPTGTLFNLNWKYIT